MYVKDLMTSNVVSIKADAKLEEAIELMYENDIRHIPVTQDDELVGIVSDRDVLPVIMGPATTAEKEELRAVKFYMATIPFTLHAEDSPAEAAAQFIEHRVGAFPVVEPQSGKIEGILSYVDLLKVVEENYNEAH